MALTRLPKPLPQSLKLAGEVRPAATTSPAKSIDVGATRWVAPYV